MDSAEIMECGGNGEKEKGYVLTEEEKVFINLFRKIENKRIAEGLINILKSLSRIK